jgi:hypothetical protein
VQYRVTLPNDREPLDKVIEVVGFVHAMLEVQAVYVDEDGYIGEIPARVLRVDRPVATAS